MTDLQGLIESAKNQIADAAAQFLNASRSNPTGPVGIHYGGGPAIGTNNFRYFLEERGNHMGSTPEPNALAYVAISSLNSSNAAHQDTYEILKHARNGFTETPHPWGGANTPLINYTSRLSAGAMQDYVDTLMDAGYAGVFIDDHDVMFEAAQQGQLTPEQFAAENKVLLDIVAQVQARGGVVVVNGIGDLNMMTSLGESGAELLVESQFAQDGTPLNGDSLSTPGEWTMDRLKAYAEAGGTYIHFVERTPLNGMSIAESRAAIAPFIEATKEQLPEGTQVSIYFAENQDYDALAFQGPNSAPNPQAAIQR